MCGDRLPSQNNFTSILGGDDEASVGDTTMLHDLSASPESESMCLNNAGINQECTINSASIVTDDQMLPNPPEELPYVPEPIQITIAENLLDVIKDTRSKDCSSKLVGESVHGSISKKALSLPQPPVDNAPETNSDVISQVENQMTSSTGIMEQTIDVPLSDDQLLSKMDKPNLLVLPTPRRSARRTKATADIAVSLPLLSETESQKDQAPLTLNFPAGDAKTTKEYDLEKSTDAPPVAQEFQANTSTRRRVKKPKELALELPEQPPPSLRRTARITRNLVKDPESSQFIIDHTIQMTVNPKSARKLKTITFQLAENVMSDQKTEPHDQQLSVTPKRGRPRRHGILKVVPQSETEPEKPQSPTPVRSGRRRKPSVPETVPVQEVQPSEQQPPVPVEQERTQSASMVETVSKRETELVEQLPIKRKRGRPRKNPLNISANSELDSSLLTGPQIDTKLVVTPQRNTRRRALNLSASIGSLPSLEATAVETPKRRHTRVVSARATKTDAKKTILGEHSVQPSEAVASAKSSERRQSKMTAIRKGHQPPTLAQEGTEEDHLSQTMDNAVELQCTDVTKLRLGETGRTLTHHDIHVKRTRYKSECMKPPISLDGSEAFYFSPPLTKLTEKSAGT